MSLVDWILEKFTGGAIKRAPAPKKPSMAPTLTLSGGVREVPPEEQAARKIAARRERIENSRRPKPPLPMDVSMVRVAREELRPILNAMFDDFLHAHYASEEVQCYRLKLATGQPAFVLFSPGEEWMDVLAPGKLKDYSYVEPGRFKRYGFSRDMSRWSYGEGPQGARSIRSAIRTLDPTIQARERL